MSAITKLLEEIRGEKAPLEVFDPKNQHYLELAIIGKI